MLNDNDSASMDDKVDYLDSSFVLPSAPFEYEVPQSPDSWQEYPIRRDIQALLDGPLIVEALEIVETQSTLSDKPLEITCSDMEPPNLANMKRQRKRRATVWGVTGGVVGFAVLGPIGGVAGGVTSAFLVKHRHKRLEKKAMKKYYQRVAQQIAAPLPREQSFSHQQQLLSISAPTNTGSA
jgi:hypothetical protein